MMNDSFSAQFHALIPQVFTDSFFEPLFPSSTDVSLGVSFFEQLLLFVMGVMHEADNDCSI